MVAHIEPDQSLLRSVKEKGWLKDPGYHFQDFKILHFQINAL
jgi:hypothetical protein